MNNLNFRIFVFMIFFLVLIINIKVIYSSQQLNYDLDLNNPIFRFYDNNFNDSTSNIIFNTSENVTLYITIPRNSTIIYSTLNLTGQLTPTQQAGTGVAYYAVAVGNVTGSSKNDIAIGAVTSPQVYLFNSSLNTIWNYSTSGQTNSIAIGYVSGGTYADVVVGSSDKKVYLLNSTGNQVWNYNLNSIVNGVTIGNLSLSDKKDVIAGANNGTTFVLNSSGTVKWTYTNSPSSPIHSLTSGNVISDVGDEIIVGDENGIYLLNSTANKIWDFSIGSIIYSLAIGEVSDDSGKDIIVGTDNGTVYLLNSSGQLKWSYDVSSGSTYTVYGVAAGDIVSGSRDEVAIGSSDHKVYVINSTGILIWTYATGDEVRGVSIGDITTDTSNETVVVSIDTKVYVLNFDYYPTNPYIDVGGDGDKDWSYPDKLRVSNLTENSSISLEIQNYLRNVCTASSCDVPFIFHSDAAGDLRINNINITYDYDASDAISYSILSNKWSRTNNTYANESIGNEVKNITYGTLGTTIHVNNIRINDTATACDFNWVQGITTTSSGKKYCVVNYDITPETSDYIWDNLMSSSIAVYYNESIESVKGSGDWEKNITVWNVTSNIFYQVIANTTLNQTVVSNQGLYVDWYNNGTFYDITPGLSYVCPSYASKQIENDTFSVCLMKNANIINFFKWIQPHTSTVVYQVRGSTNNPSNLTNPSVTPPSGIWGNEFNFTINVSDQEGDNVTVNLWVYLSNFGTWEQMGSKNTTILTNETPESITFNVNSNKSWIGDLKYKFQYRDFDVSTGYIYHSWQETSNYTGLNVQKHNVSIIHVSGNYTTVNKTSGVMLVVQVNDTNNATIVNEGVNCIFWVTKDGVNFDSGHTNQTNSSGYCNYTFLPDSTYIAGTQLWKAGVYSDTYYNNQNSTNFTIFIESQVNINLTNSVVNRNFTRGQNVSLEAKLYDEGDNTVTESGFNCSWYVNNSLLGNSITNSSGYCKYTWNTTCSNLVGYYTINVTLWNSTSTYYKIQTNISSTVVTLKDNLNLNIIYPVDWYIIHEKETIMLNSSITDACSNIPTQNYIVKWYFRKLDECPLVNPVAAGDNTTWTLNATCTPRQQNISANTSSEFYYTGNDNVSIYIYGWSKVQIIYPTNDSTINRSEVGEFTNIICKIEDNTTGNLYPQNYPVKFWYDQNYIGVNLTNASGISTYKWNITNETVPDGYYEVKCNITDNSTLFYNTSITESNASNVRVLGDPDIIPPRFVWVHANSVQYGNNVTIETYVKDFYSIDKVWINITNSTTSFVRQMQNTSTVIYEGIWNYSENLTKGDYDYIIYANDTSGNGPNSTTGWFEVYLPILFYGNTKDSLNNNVSVEFIFYRNDTNNTIHQFSTNSSNSYYNETIHNRTYDIDVKAYNHTIKFISVIMNENTVNSVSNISTFSTTVGTIIGVRNYLKTFVIKSTLNYTSVNITFNYSNVIDFYTDPYYPYTFREQDIDIYRCSNFTIIDVATWNCSDSGGWTNLNVNPKLTTHTIIANLSSLSGFIVGDTADPNDGRCDQPGETCTYDTTCCGSPPTTISGSTGGGPSGGTSGISPTCGNNECEAGENSENCPEDCGSPEGSLKIRTNLTDVQLDAGEKKDYVLWILNNLKYKINATVSIVGTASDFITIDKTPLDVGSSTEVIDKLFVNIPNNAESGTYTGQIYVTSEGKSQSLPFTITISMKSATILEITVETKNLNKEVDINGTAKFQIFLYDLGFRKKFDVNLNYLIKDFQTEHIIYNESELKKLESTETYIKSLHLSKLNITPGHYLFEVYAFYEGKNTTATDDFYVIATFWTSAHILQFGLIIAISVSIFSVYYGRKRYKMWKQSKARYIFPMDMNRLPKGDIWLGKIAETNTKTFFNMNDLNTHILVAGATGSGKSVSASIFVEELLNNKIPVVVFDPTAQWTGFVKPCRDENLIKYYKEFGMSVNDTKPYTGMIYEVTDPNVKIDFKKYMIPGEITVFTLNKLKPGQYDEAVTNIIDTIFNQGWEESTTIRMIIVFDEVHRLLEKYGGKGGYVALERACREFRKWGIGLLMASQVLSDFKEAIKGNVLTEIQLHTKSLGDLTRIEKKYGLEYAKKVTREEVGVGMMQNPKYNEGRPWFIAFRPTYHSPHKISDEEMNTYREYTAILADAESKIDTMEKSGIDVFDLKTELKLAKDKLKKGRFRMAKIYIDSLTKNLNEG